MLAGVVCLELPGCGMNADFAVTTPLRTFVGRATKAAMSDEPFVEREFESGAGAILARFLQPTLEAGREYRCRWAIIWPDRVQQSYSCGLDGIQALMLAMKSVHTVLMESDLYKSGKLTYVDQYDLDLPPSWGDAPIYVPPNRDGT